MTEAKPHGDKPQAERHAARCIQVGRPRQLGAYAALPGTGPADQTCRACSHCVERWAPERHRSREIRRCRRWAKMMRIPDTTETSARTWPTIRTPTAACRYFE